MSYLLLSLDPGSSRHATSHTGAVLFSVPRDEPAFVDSSWAVRGGLDGFREWVEESDLLEWADSVIVEQFVDRQIAGADRTPMLIEGAVRFLRPDAILSPPSGYKQAVPDRVLKQFDCWFEGDHHNDRRSAARHALRWLRSNHMPTAKKGWGWIRD